MLSPRTFVYSCCCGLREHVLFVTLRHVATSSVEIGKPARQSVRLPTRVAMAALHLLIPITAALTPPVRVWDGVFAQPDLSIIATSGERRQHSFTSVFDRHAFPKGRTVLERSLASILDALDDSSQYIEYWWREEWKSIEAHRDVDETLCLSRKHAGSPLGVQRCPNNGHVLYVDVEDDVRGPTCVWVEEPPPDDFKLAATAEEADGRAGPPRELQSMVVVPCRAGRLLRFSGEAIHAVPRPSCEWLKDDDDAEQDGKAVVLLRSRTTTMTMRRALVVSYPSALRRPFPPSAAPSSYSTHGMSRLSCRRRTTRRLRRPLMSLRALLCRLRGVSRLVRGLRLG